MHERQSESRQPGNGGDPTCEACTSRRGFLAATGFAATTVLLEQVFSGYVHADDVERPVRFATFPRTKIAELPDLKVGEPVPIVYPPGLAMSEGTLYVLGRRAGGGIGPNKDVVAFSRYCTHMGGDLGNAFSAEHAVAGPCPDHLTTFDLTRHGMVVAGHAVQPLPQIVLELDGDDVVAVGVAGLLYGHHALPVTSDSQP